MWLEDINEPTHQLFVTIDPGWKNPRYKSIYDFGIVANGAIQFAQRNVFGRRTTPIIKPKVWTHIAASYDIRTDKVGVYVDGIKITTFTGIDTRRSDKLNQNWKEETSIGKFVYTPSRVRYMRGRVDEYYIYPCALGAEQVNLLKDKTCEESRFFMKFSSDKF